MVYSFQGHSTMAANHLPMFSQSPTVKKKNIPQTMSPTAPGARDSMLSIHSAGLSPPASDAQMSSPLASKTSSTWGKVADEPKSNSCISPQSGVVPSDSIIRSSLAQQLTRDICLSEGGSSSDEASYLGRHFLSQENLQAETSADGAWHTLAESLVGDSPLDSASAEEDPEMTLKARRCSGQMKRTVDQYSPMAKRSRSMPEMATLSLRFPLFSSPPSFSCTPPVTPSPPFYRCRYQWGGPSTYGMHCVRQNSLVGGTLMYQVLSLIKLFSLPSDASGRNSSRDIRRCSEAWGRGACLQSRVKMAYIFWGQQDV